MRKFFFRFLLVVFPIAVIVTMVNYTIDPANIFSTNVYVKGIAEILSAGHNVDNISNYDERLLQEQMVYRLTATPDIVVLGSSRVMQIGSDFFPGKKVLNCGVSHANIKDIVAITGLLDSMKRMPAVIILNADPGLICQGGTSEWKSLDGYYHSISGKLNGTANSNTSPGLYTFKKKLSSLFSLQYFQSAVQFIGKGRTKKYTDVGNQLPALYGRLSDGTVSYSYAYMHPDSVLAAATANEEGRKGHFGDVDKEQEALLERLLEYLAVRKVQVQLCLLPYHPAFYKSVNDNHSQQLLQYAAWFKDLAARKKLSLTGNFDPAVYQIPAASFYDDSHSSKESLRKILLQQ